MPLFSLRGLVRDGIMEAAEARVLAALRRHHPWLFDWALKWRIVPAVFEARRVFDKAYRTSVTGRGYNPRGATSRRRARRER